jgi:phosphate transport system permease protein
MSLHGETYERRLIWRHRMGLAFEWLCRLATLGALGMLVLLLVSVVVTALSPGRGKGQADVTINLIKSSDNNSTPVKFRVTKTEGGRFELKSRPGTKISEFSEADVRDGLVAFDHNGRRSTPMFDLTTIAADGSEKVFEKVEPGKKNANTILSVNPPPKAKPWGWLTWGFLNNFNSYDPLEAGISAGLWGSIWLIGLTGLMAVPVGVGAAVYLEEYSKPSALTKLIQLNIANLAGVPSIVYGILGFTVFSRMFGMFDGEKTIVVLNLLIFSPIEISLPFGPVVISGACTLALLSLPVIIISSQEALRSVPASLRHAAYALGATKWQTIWHQVLPAALPGILTGVILSLSRAIGEAAPLAVIGVAAQLSYAPGRITGLADLVQHPDKLIRAPFDRFTALPIQVYSWISEAAPNFEHVAAAGILVLLATLLTMNGTAIFIRQHFQQKIRW